MIPIIDVALKIADKLIPDPKAKAEAQLRILELQQAGQFREIELQLSAIIAEAQSIDPWTSRARPSFLYVFYALLLAAIPMGLVTAISPEFAGAITEGFKAWLHAIPEEIVTLFGVGYLGYTGARSWDKRKKS